MGTVGLPTPVPRLPVWTSTIPTLPTPAVFEPKFGIGLHIDTSLLTRVMLDMPKREDRWTCAVAAGDLNGAVGEALARFVGLLGMPEDIGMFASHYETELYYRLLQSPMGDTLRQIGQRNDRFLHDWLAANHSEPTHILDLAASAGMSVTSFHRLTAPEIELRCRPLFAPPQMFDHRAKCVGRPRSCLDSRD
jgi:hypothetical protein